MALFDLLGKAAGLPLWRLLGGYPPTHPHQRHHRHPARGRDRGPGAGIRRPRASGASSSRAAWTSNCDVERVLKVREAVGPTVELRFDANQGYTVEQTLAFVDGRRSGQARAARAAHAQGRTWTCWAG